MKAPHLVLLLLVNSGLIACDNNKPSVTTPISQQQTVKKYSQTTQLVGAVSNQQGRVKEGYINVTDVNYQSITTVKVTDNGQYHVEIPAQTPLPIILNYHPNENISNGEQQRVVVIDPSISKYDINPLTTVIAQKAKEMGGYTRKNLVMAAENSVHVPDANKTSAGFRGDPTTQYGGWH